MRPVEEKVNDASKETGEWNRLVKLAAAGK